MGRSSFKIARGTGFAAGLTALVCLGACLVRAQDAGQQPASQQPAHPPATSTPTGPVNPIGSEEQAGGTVEQAPAPPPDTRPLAGAQELTPTLPGSGRSYVIPSFSVWAGADSNAQVAPGVTEYVGAAIPVGSLDLNYAGRKNQLNVDYGGGGILYLNGEADSAAFQDFTFSEFYNARRWNFLLMDRATYLPQASLGFGGISYAGVFNTGESLGLGSGSSEMGQIFVPGQSLLLGRVGTFSNNAVVQTQYFLTPRTSVSAVASFGIQHYDQESLSSGNNRVFVGSIDHQVTPTDTLTFAYDLIQYRYTGGSATINDNVFQLGYGHRVTSRISLLLLGGPAVIYSAYAGVPGTQQKWTWVAQARAAYRANLGSFNIGYVHFASPGSGLYEGAQTDSVTGSFTRNLTRTWTGLINLSWARNTELLASPTVNPAPAGPGPINYEVGSIRLDHTMGRHMKVFGVYALEHQKSPTAIVPGYSGTEIFRQIFGIGIEVHPRPLGF